MIVPAQGSSDVGALCHDVMSYVAKDGSDETTSAIFHPGRLVKQSKADRSNHHPNDPKFWI